MSRNTTMLATKPWQIRAVLIWVNRIDNKCPTVFAINLILNFDIFNFLIKTWLFINFRVLRNCFWSMFFWLTTTRNSFYNRSSIWMIFFPGFYQLLIVTRSSRSKFVFCKLLINFPAIMFTEFFFNRFYNNFFINSIRKLRSVFFNWTLITALNIIFYRTSTSYSF